MLLCVLGSMPRLSLAELEAVVGHDLVKPVGQYYALVNDKNGFLHERIGGTIKAATLLSTLPSSRWNKVSAATFDVIVSQLEEKAKNSNHKLTLGISAYGFRISPKQLWLLAFAINKNLKKKGYSVRIVMGKEFTLNSAQVIHNKLTGEFGSEFLLVANGAKTYIAKTVSVQNIDSYSKRDYGKPNRDMNVGMLPPKLAQIMINLAKLDKNRTLLDPFCGTGSILMEAALLGSKLEGGDIKKRMVDYTKANLDWLAKEYNIKIDYNLICADATTHKWSNKFDCVATETYLGPSIRYVQDYESIKKASDYCNKLVEDFLTNLRPQLTNNAQCCIAVPMWHFKDIFIHLPIVKEIENLGYCRVNFTHVNNSELVYYREGQVVGRELLVLQKI